MMNGFGALKQAAEDREGWRHRERMSKTPAVQQKTTDDDCVPIIPVTENNLVDSFFGGTRAMKDCQMII